ncbi:MAG TPA: hypothetical protein VFH73_20930, partial [Polyangia bacterium]|nr:hypothetical protein [Polyangia bacterium]
SRLPRRVWVASALAIAMALGALALAGPAQAAEVTRVVSALDDDNRFDLNLTLSWQHEAKSAFIKRESQSAVSPGTELIKDLKYQQTRDLLNFRADFGVMRDVGFHIEAPLVVSDQRSLDFDQSEGHLCIYPGDPGGRPTCVNEQNSTLLRDGILPGAGQANYGLDAPHARSFTRPSSQVFQGPKRSGFESLGAGLTWAIFNQARDDTKPTWTLGFVSKFDVGAAMRFDPAKPNDNTAVGLGYHQFIWSTTVSKRFRYFDPYFGMWYMLPARTNGSPFERYPGGAQTTVGVQQRAGLQIGVEYAAWENTPRKQRVTIELRGRAEQRFFGRSHSELWEALSGSSACRTDVTKCRAGLDEDLNGDGKPDPYPGVTETQAYAIFGGDVGLNVQVGRYVRFRGLFGLAVDMPHFITFAGAGVDTNNDGRVDSNSPAEANPVYREAIDLPGRRFKVEGTQIWTLVLEGAVMF